jgi:hypothetical protein
MESEKLRNVFPKVSDKFRESVENTLNSLENKEVIIMESKKSKKFKPLKMAAAGVAAALALTIGVGAINGWNYSNVFGGLFRSGTEAFEFIPHTIVPQVRNGVNPLTGVETSPKGAVDVLGVAGDSKALYVVAEIRGDFINDSSLIGFQVLDFTPISTGESVVRTVNGGEFIGDFFIDYSGGTQVLSEGNNSKIVAFAFEFVNLVLEKGWVSFAFYDMSPSSVPEDERDDIIVFDVLLDYDFTAIRIFEVCAVSNMPLSWLDENNNEYGFGESPTVPVLLESVEVTPIAVRIVTEITEYSGINSVLITFKDGSTMFSGEDFLHGCNGGGTWSREDAVEQKIHFNAPFDLDDVHSVTVGDIEIVF